MLFCGAVVRIVGTLTLCVGGNLCVMHCSLILCCSSFSDRPGLLCTFCVRVIGDAHLTSSGLIGSMMSAARSSSMVSLR